MNFSKDSRFVILTPLAAAALVACFALSTVQAAPTPKTTAKAIEGSVTCQCGCNMTVSGCNHEGCGSKAEMEAMAEQEVASGKDNAAILQAFVLKYGTKVLATPPPTGFNLTVWILPILLGVAGLTLVVVLVRRWRRVPVPLASAHPAPVDPEILAELEEEMKRL